MSQKIIPYERHQLEFHLYNNFYPYYTEKTIEGMIDTIEKVNAGELLLTDSLPGSDIPVYEMLDDLYLDYHDQN